MTKRLRLNKPRDVRALIKDWLRDVCETGELPFQNGGVIVQLLNTWLKSYELEKVSELEKRIKELELIRESDMGGSKRY
jgi:hypothetical protein